MPSVLCFLIIDIVKITHDLSGINMSLLNYFKNSGINIKEYLNDWICTELYFRDCERNGFNKIDKINYLIQYLKI